MAAIEHTQRLDSHTQDPEPSDVKENFTLGNCEQFRPPGAPNGHNCARTRHCGRGSLSAQRSCRGKVNARQIATVPLEVATILALSKKHQLVACA